MRERKRPPVHPGRIIKSHHLIPLSMSVSDLADLMKVSRKTASKIVNERGPVTPDMALRLSRAFNTTPQLWLGLQLEYDLWHAARNSRTWRSIAAAKENESALNHRRT